MTAESYVRPPVQCGRGDVGACSSVDAVATYFYPGLVVLLATSLAGAFLSSTGSMGAPRELDHPPLNATPRSTLSEGESHLKPSNSASGGAVWTNVSSVAGGPSPRATAGIAYDAADSYVVLFGGQVYTSAYAAEEHTTCAGDTWIFQNGLWRNLSISGPPANCAPEMTYDAADGYVIETGGWMRENVSHCACFLDYNQTWVFSHGRWQNLSTYTPSLEATYGPNIAYDPDLREVLACTLAGSGPEEWGFADGAWSAIQVPPGATNCGGFWDLSYDLSMKGMVAFNDTFASPGPDTWLLRNGSWSELGTPPAGVLEGGELAFDPVLNCTVYFGETIPPGAPSSDWQNVTWVMRNGQWSNASVGGPKVRAYQAMVFDAHDGYLLMFGGTGYPPVNDYGASLLRETWTLAPPPAEIRLSLAASPSPICSRGTVNCGAGTVTTRVTLEVAALEATPNASFGSDSGAGFVTWAPQFWIDNPTLLFAGWDNLVPSSGTALDASSNCVRAGGDIATCGALPGVAALPNGNSVLRWSWGVPSTNNTLLVGDTWTVSFNEVAVGPPFGLDPIDACSTALCNSSAVQAVDGFVAGLSFSPYGNDTIATDTAPLARVDVLAGPTPPNTVPGSAPPSSPPPIGAPLPIGTPTPPLPTPSPVANAVSSAISSASGTLSLTALAGGLVGAGVARGSLRASPQRVGQLNRVAGRRVGPPPSRGVD